MNRSLVIMLILIGLLVPGAHAGLVIDCTDETGGLGCDNCTSGNLLFSWRMEGDNNTERLDVRSGEPPDCGCAVPGGDPIATLISDATFSTAYAHDGLASLSIPGSLDCAEFTANGMIWSHEGSLEMWVRVGAWQNINPALFLYQYDPDNTMRLSEVGTSGTDIEFRAYYDAATGTAETLTTTQVNGTVGAWYRIVFKWRASTLDPSLCLSVYDVSGQLLDQVTTNTDIHAFIEEGETFSIGNWAYTTANEPLFIDGVKIWNTWIDD